MPPAIEIPNQSILFWTVMADAFIAFSYYIIPLEILYFSLQFSWNNKQIHLPHYIYWISTLFVIFILACGTTHIISAYFFYHPTWKVNLVMKGITAIVSLLTAIFLLFTIPKLLEIPIQLNTMELEIQDRLLQEEILNQQLQEALKAKTDFLMNVSHEIRTPLNGLIGISLLNISNKDIPSNVRKDLEMFQFSGEILLRILNDILDFHNEIYLVNQPFKLRDMMEKLQTMFHYAFNEKNINFTLSINDNVPDNLIGDSQRILQILIKLLDNSIKFTPENGDITVQITKDEHLSDDVHFAAIKFSVIDNGIGISDDKIENIFKLTPGDGPYQSGLGLGLVVSKKIIDKMGGQLTIESLVGKGTNVSFIILLQIV